MNFLKFLWKDNKAFAFFIITFVLVFHVYGSLYADVTLHDLLPFYGLIGAAGLTFVVYDWRKYNSLKDKGEL